MTFEERFDINNPAIIKAANESININWEEMRNTHAPADLIKDVINTALKTQQQYFAVRRLYKSIDDRGSLFTLDAKWNGDTKSYVEQAQYIVATLCALPTEHIICGSCLATYIQLSPNFKRDSQNPVGVYKIGVLISKAEVYKAPSEVIPSDEFMYYDINTKSFKKGKVENIKDY